MMLCPPRDLQNGFAVDRCDSLAVLSAPLAMLGLIAVGEDLTVRDEAACGSAFASLIFRRISSFIGHDPKPMASLRPLREILLGLIALLIHAVLANSGRVLAGPWWRGRKACLSWTGALPIRRESTMLLGANQLRKRGSSTIPRLFRLNGKVGELANISACHPDLFAVLAVEAQFCPLSRDSFLLPLPRAYRGNVGQIAIALGDPAPERSRLDIASLASDVFGFLGPGKIDLLQPFLVGRTHFAPPACVNVKCLSYFPWKPRLRTTAA